MTPDYVLPTHDVRMAARAWDKRRPMVLHQRWESLLFLHWRCPAEIVQRSLPPGLYVDTYEGMAYVAVVPLFMCNIRPRFLPSVPWVSHFLELNVRTYVHDRHGVPGVWFYALECERPLTVWIARAMFGLPYLHAHMSAHSTPASGAGPSDLPEIAYASTRFESSPDALEGQHRATSSYIYRGTGPERLAEPGSLEFFFVERYYLHSLHHGNIVRAQVAHTPYRYTDAIVEKYSAHPLVGCGLPLPEEPPCHQCFVRGVDVFTYAPEVLYPSPSR
ncbi:MAG: YqjF family protein [Candidatus Methylacidiphilales bacterium]